MFSNNNDQSTENCGNILIVKFTQNPTMFENQ